LRRHPFGRHDDHLPAAPEDELAEVVEYVVELRVARSPSGLVPLAMVMRPAINRSASIRSVGAPSDKA